MSEASTNGHWTSERGVGGRIPDPSVNASGAPVDGTLIEIPQHLIEETYEASKSALPDYPPQEEEIRPVADSLSDEAAKNQVASTLLSHPVIAAALLVAGMVKRACSARREELDRFHQRLLKYQASLPESIPSSRSTSQHRNLLREIGVFWLNWSGLAFAGLTAWLVITIVTEVLYQIGGLRESSWGLVQSFFGAFGFCWGFTMAVVVATYWRRHTLGNPNAHPLDKHMSRVAFLVAWWGLAGFGWMMGLMHSFEVGEGLLLPHLRCALTTASVISLGMLCVAIEKGAERCFRQAYKWTLVRNVQIDAMDKELHPVVTQLMTLVQIEDLAQQVERRVEQHICSQQQRWLNRRDAIRLDNSRQRDIAAEEQKILLSQNRLASLRATDAN